MPLYEDDSSATQGGKRYRFSGIPKALWTTGGLRIGDDEEPAAILDLATPNPTTAIRISAGAAPATTWELEANDTDGALNVSDVTAGTTPAKILNGAPDDSLVVHGSGDVGFGASPSTDLHLYRAGTTAELLIEAAGVNSAALVRVKNDAKELQIGIGPDDAFRVYDNTSSLTPLLIEPAAPTNSLYVDASGNIGSGTSAPARELHVRRSADSIVFVRAESLAVNSRAGFEMANDARRYQVICETDDTFIVRDATATTDPLTIEPAAPTDSLYVDASGQVGFGTSTPTEVIDVNSDAIRIRTSSTPASATATGAIGEIRWDSSFIYVCTATDTWKRAAIATW